jgi:hypothetical protein
MRGRSEAKPIRPVRPCVQRVFVNVMSKFGPDGAAPEGKLHITDFINTFIIIRRSSLSCSVKHQKQEQTHRESRVSHDRSLGLMMVKRQ